MTETQRRERRGFWERLGRPETWSFAAAVILSAATLATAWCSYQAASWNSEAGVANRSATVARFEATRQGDIADRQIQSDLLIFATWLEAETAGNEALALGLEDRFRTAFVPAFEAWRALAEDGELAPGSPFDLPEYVLPGWEEEERLNRAAADFAAEADAASQVSSGYVLSAVLYASVMFLAGIASKLPGQRGSRFVTGLGGVLLIVAVVTTLARPMDLGF